MTLKTFGRCGAVMNRRCHLGPDQGYLGCNAFNAHQVVEVARGQGSGGDVPGPEAALETDVKLFALLGVARVQGADILFQRTLKLKQKLRPAYTLRAFWHGF